MDTGYKEIVINPNVNDEESISVKIEGPDDGTIEQVSQEPKVQQEADPATIAPVTEPKQPRESRAQKRIKELHARVQDREGQLEQERREKAELQKQLLQGHASTKESFKTTLEGQIKSLNSQIAQAMNSGNADLAVQLQEQWMNSKMELQSLNKEISTHQADIQKAESATNHPQQPRNQVPEKALEWIEDHPEFNTDAIFNGAAIAVNNQLLREGFDPSTEDFYAEINERLASHFPKVFGVEAKGMVQLEGRQTNADSSFNTKQPDVKQVIDAAPAASTKVRTVEQVVSGSSRPSANTIPKRKVTEVTLTPHDVRQAEAWGWSLERMAKRIMHIENNRHGEESTYVPIKIEK